MAKEMRVVPTEVVMKTGTKTKGVVVGEGGIRIMVRGILIIILKRRSRIHAIIITVIEIITRRVMMIVVIIQ